MNNFEEIIDAKLKLLMADYHEFEDIIKNLPIEVKKQLINVNDEISSLEKALKSVPEQFDVDFSRKMNRILDVVSEVEQHTRKLNNTIQADNSDKIEKQAELYASTFNNKIDGYSVTSFGTLVIWGLLCSMVGGGLASFMVWFIFPKIF